VRKDDADCDHEGDQHAPKRARPQSKPEILPAQSAHSTHLTYLTYLTHPPCLPYPTYPPYLPYPTYPPYDALIFASAAISSLTTASGSGA